MLMCLLMVFHLKMSRSATDSRVERELGLGNDYDTASPSLLCTHHQLLQPQQHQCHHQASPMIPLSLGLGLSSPHYTDPLCPPCRPGCCLPASQRRPHTTSGVTWSHTGITGCQRQLSSLMKYKCSGITR